jgi:hypothetical protein
MRRDSLTWDAWSKWRRGNQHLKALKAELDSVYGPNGDPVWTETQFNREHVPQFAELVVGGGVYPLREDCFLMLGDAISNYRAALEYIAQAMVKAGTARGLSTVRRRQIQFPMVNSAKRFEKVVLDQLPGVRPEHLALVQRHQPYRRGKEPAAIRWLRRLADKDKHRRAIRTYLIPGRYWFGVAGARMTGFEYPTRPRPLKRGTPIVRVFLRDVTGPVGISIGDAKDLTRPPEVYVNGNLPVYPSCGYRCDVRLVVRNISSVVGGILEAVEPLP